MEKLPQKVIESLGYYVYLYINPIDDRIFYIGKGVGQRVLSHMDDRSETQKKREIFDIQEQGFDPRIEILAHGLRDNEEAERIEAACIDLLGRSNLTNLVRGTTYDHVGRIPLRELVTLYSAEPVIITDPVVLIRINRLYNYSMTDQELYEATRGKWKLGARRKKATYALAVFRGLVREVYQIDQWVPAGTSEYYTNVHEPGIIPGRWEFFGQVADQVVRERYIDKSVKYYFKAGQQSPIVYCNC